MPQEMQTQTFNNLLIKPEKIPNMFRYLNAGISLSTKIAIYLFVKLFYTCSKCVVQYIFVDAAMHL